MWPLSSVFNFQSIWLRGKTTGGEGGGVRCFVMILFDSKSPFFSLSLSLLSSTEAKKPFSMQNNNNKKTTKKDGVPRLPVPKLTMFPPAAGSARRARRGRTVGSSAARARATADARERIGKKCCRWRRRRCRQAQERHCSGVSSCCLGDLSFFGVSVFWKCVDSRTKRQKRRAPLERVRKEEGSARAMRGKRGD